MKIVRYFFVGGAAGVIDFLLFALLVKFFRFYWFPAAMASFVTATAANYWLSIRHVFDSGVRFSRQHEVALVFFVSGIGLAINQFILWILIETLQWDPLLAKVFATSAVFFWNFSARHKFIFKAR